MLSPSLNDRRCDTCRHRVRLGESLPHACIGCLKDGICTKWEQMEDKAND